MARAKVEGATLSYDYSLKGDGSAVATIDLDKAFGAIGGYSNFPQNLKDCVFFSLKTAMRNASAGKLDTEENAVLALAAGKKRAEAIEAGKWQAAREASEPGERITILDKALAEVLGCSEEDAHQQVLLQITAALEEAKIDPDVEPSTPDEKKARNKIVRETRRALRESAEVAEVADRMELEAKQAELERKAKARQGTTAKSLNDILPK